MALKNRTVVDQRIEAVKRIEAGESISDVADRLGISRQSLYNWLARFKEAGGSVEGEAALMDRSRRPRFSPNKTPDEIEQLLLAEQKKWGFGAKKILRRCRDHDPTRPWPQRSTVDAIFKRNGLVVARPQPRRRFAPVPAVRATPSTRPGEVNTADYKGQVRLRNGSLCYPLTMADPASRYLLACDAFGTISLENTWATFVRVFREWGLPSRLHSDNGIPFGTSGHGRYSTIAVRLMKYGVQPTYSRPGHPQDNGAHERMHKTLLEDAMLPQSQDLEAQQRRFDEFRQTFNHERPHEALGQDRPAHHQRKAPRAFPEKEPELVYDAHLEVRKVDGRGRIRWNRADLFFSEAFAGEAVAFEQIDSSRWHVIYGDFRVGTFDGATPRLG